MTTPRVFVALAFAAACALAGCSTPSPTATDAPSAEASARPSTKASATPTSTPTPTPTPTSPLNGLPQPDQDEPSPVLVVKLDNTRFAQPHAGLDRADIVYIEEVEYGITRLAAVFSSAVPKRIGPVRSARITDIDLLDQYGSPAFSFSGAQRKMWPVIANSSLIDISPNKAAFAYQRDFSRRAPYNYFVNGFEGLTAVPDASQARDIGLSFDSTPPPNGSVGLSARYEWSASTAEFTYDQASRLYRVSLNGRNAEAEETPDGQRAATVVIQYVKQEPSRFFDKGGGNTPHAITIGKGAAVVLRDGLMYRAKWSRPDAESGTTFTDDQGQVLAFKPGQQWIVLANRNVTATLFPTPPPPKDTDKSKESASDQSE
ncbi:MAG: DUF3048 domain-containing protein [Actinomycetales bacterium]|nr:MAG: DUF3048 domain-containing protein [Actinomycetales bacterium]